MSGHTCNTILASPVQERHRKSGEDPDLRQRIVKIIRGLEKLKDAGIRVFLQFTVTKLQF